ncbi:MAG: GNAT family N-acetyltransferase [Candidatus Bathyarchaeia archaeon]|nr:GNAT family N-acetyltransferase [Candidatus Bathyarchaeota archaeon]
MSPFKIRDVELEDLDSLINFCIPMERRNERFFIEGAKAKKRWASKSLELFGSIAKMAYMNSTPVGLIQFQPELREKLLEITCIFVPDRRNQRKGIGKALLNSLIEDAKKPRDFFGKKPPLALVTWAFQVPGYYPQNEFYLRMGFRKASEYNPLLLYYPLKKGYIYRPREGKYVPQAEDKGKALIFYDPSCPFCMYFAEQIKSLVRKAAPSLPIRMINMFEEPEEVEKRGQVPNCIVNGKAITAFFMDKENFQREIKEALLENKLNS